MTLLTELIDWPANVSVPLLPTDEVEFPILRALLRVESTVMAPTI
jgi:hypothetical protein